MTLIKAIKWGIALGPVSLFAANSYSAAGGGTAGATQAGRTFVSAYTGWDIVNNQFSPQSLQLGYIPLIGSIIFGKVAGRFLR